MVEGQGHSYYVVTLIADAGTYIKEFIHGDDNRTFPSFGHLLKNTDLNQYTTQEINEDWVKSFDKETCAIDQLDVIGLVLSDELVLEDDW